MSAVIVLSVYAAALVVAVAILYFQPRISWVWHVLAVAAALALGMTPMPAGWAGPSADLMVGGVFTLLFVWGMGGIVMHVFHIRREKHA